MNKKFIPRWWLAFCAGLLAFSCTGRVRASVSEDAVVTIWATPASGSPWVGTGFFLNKDAEVLTCYHVVKDARKLTIYRGKEAYADIDVVAISPEHDLALLRVNNTHQPVSFLELSQDSPAQFLTKQLIVYGYLAGQLQQKLPATPTAADYVLSGNLKSFEGGDRIFRLREVKLISMNMTIFNGFSGGPVVSGDKVVGVVSGSLTQGGTIAWAIPAIYATVDQMIPIGQALSAVKGWPALSLMQEGPAWNTLRLGLSLTAGLSLALDAYVDSLDTSARSLKNITSSVRNMEDAIDDLYRKGDLLIAARQKGDDTSLLQVEFKGSYAFLTFRLTTFLSSANVMPKNGEQVSERIDALGSELDHFLDTLPDTAKNRTIAKNVRKQVIALSHDITRRAHRYHKSFKDYEKKLARLETSYKRIKTPSYDQNKAHMAKVKLLIHDFFLNRTQSDVTSMISSFRAIGDVSDALLNLSSAPTHSAGESPVGAVP